MARKWTLEELSEVNRKSRIASARLEGRVVPPGYQPSESVKLFIRRAIEKAVE